MKKQRWSQEEVNLLRDLYANPNNSIETIATAIHRSKASIMNKVERTSGVRRVFRPKWEGWEDEVLKEGFSTEGLRETLGRSSRDILKRKSELGIPSQCVPWSLEEVDLLLQVYPDNTIPIEQIENSFPMRSRQSIRGKANSFGVHRRTIMDYDVISDYFDIIDKPEKAYSLGLMIADGFVRGKSEVGIGLSIKDAELVRWFTKQIVIGKEPSLCNRGTMLRTVIANEHMNNSLRKYGVVPHKSKSIVWPQGICPEFETPFIMGLFDGDGCLRWSPGGGYAAGGTWEWILVGNAPLLEGVKIRLEEGVGVSMHKVSPMSGNCSRLKTIHKRVEKIDSFFSEYNFGLKRKRIKHYFEFHPEKRPRSNQNESR